MSSHDVFATAASIAIATTSAIGAVGWVGRKTWLGMARIHRFLDDFEGTPARSGVPERPGVMSRLGSIEEKVGQAEIRFGDLDERMDTISSHVLDEIPKNGKPLAVKVDALYRSLVEGSGPPLKVEAAVKIDHDALNPPVD